MKPQPRPPKLWEAILPIGIAALIIGLGVFSFSESAPVPILLMLTWIAPALIAQRLGWRWSEIEEGMIHGMSLALNASLILLIVGATIGAWTASGTVASLIEYGLGILSPDWFLPAAVVICAIVSVATGSSWSTAATVGIALMGIGQALNISPAMTAGAVISGSYFGDKMSPLSDTTNLAPGIAGTNLFAHIHAMLFTTIPALIVTLIGFVILGWLSPSASGQFDPQGVKQLSDALRQGQDLSPWLLLPPLLVIALALFKVPAIPSLAVATVAGVLFAWLYQGQSFESLMGVLYRGYHSNTGDSVVDKLLSRGGAASMLDTIALILAATALGGILEKGGFIAVLLEALLKRVHSARGLVTATLASSIGVNILLAEQYLAIVLPGRMFRESYPKMGLQPRMLSRTLEDGGTVTSALVPWNSGGAYMSATLGVATVAYLPYAFFNLSMPIIALISVWAGLFILRQDPEAVPAEKNSRN